LATRFFEYPISRRNYGDGAVYKVICGQSTDREADFDSFDTRVRILGLTALLDADNGCSL